MDSDKKMNFNKNQHTLYFSNKQMKHFEENCFDICGKEKEDVKNAVDFFSGAVEKAEGNIEYRTKPEDLELIKKLQNENSIGNEIITGLRNQIKELEQERITTDDNVTELTQKLETKDTELQKVTDAVNDFSIQARQNEIEIKNLQEELETKIELKENQVIVTLNEFQLSLINKYLFDKKTVESFKTRNYKGKFNGVFDIINTENHKTNIANLLTTTIVGNASRLRLTYILSSNQIKEAIKKFISK